MRFGVCTSVEHSRVVQAAGWDFLEESVQARLRGLEPDSQWQGRREVEASALPVLAANGLVPGTLKIVGPDRDRAALAQYMQTVLRRAASTAIRTLVFGSGAARHVPEGYDRALARDQIIDFLRDASPVAERHGVTIVIEPLNRGECNIINTIAEAMEYVRAVGHPHVACLLDTFHFWIEDEPLAHLREAMGQIRHVHLADRDGRVAPGESGTADYRPVFSVLKSGEYEGLISVEANFPDLAGRGPGVLAFIRRQWAEA